MHEVADAGSDLSRLAHPTTGHSGAMKETVPDVSKSLGTSSSLHEASPARRETVQRDSDDLEIMNGSRDNSILAQGDDSSVALARLGHGSFWGRHRRKFLEAIDRLGRFLRGLAQWRFKSAPRAFDVPFGKRLGFYHIANNADIERIVNEIVNNPDKKSIRTFLRLEKGESIDDFAMMLKADLLDVGKFTKHFSAKYKELLDSNQQIFSEIKPVLKSNDSPRLEATLAKKISAHRTETLWYDQRILSRWLLKNDEKYLADSFGILGPNNIFSDEVKSIVSTPQGVKNWNIPENLDSEVFVDQLALLQEKLAMMLDYDRALALAIQERREIPIYPSQVMNEISEIEQKLAVMVGDRKVLQKVLNKIQTSDLLKSFNLELTDPKSEAAYVLQLVEPWGTFRKLESIPLEKLTVENLGISETIGAHQLVERQASIAAQNIKSRLKLLATAKKIQETLQKKLTSKGMKKVSDFFLLETSLESKS